MVWKKVGQVGVDSGSLVLVDPAYLTKKNVDRLFNECSKTTLKKKFGGVLGNKYRKSLGVCSSTGYGDGVYDVFASVENTPFGKRVAELRVRFVTPKATKWATAVWKKAK